MLAVDIFACARPPELASVVDGSMAINDAILLLEDFVAVPEGAVDAGRVHFLSELLATLGINNVNREKVLLAFVKEGSLLENFAALAGISSLEFGLHNLAYLASTLASMASVDLKRGLVHNLSFTTEVHLVFFSKEDVHYKVGGIFPHYAPNEGATPEQVLTLRSPGYGSWFYYDAESSDRYDAKDISAFQGMQEGRMPVRQVLTQLQSHGAVHGDWLGLDQAHINMLRRAFLDKTHSSFGLGARTRSSFKVDPKTGGALGNNSANFC